MRISFNHNITHWTSIICVFNVFICFQQANKDDSSAIKNKVICYFCNTCNQYDCTLLSGTTTYNAVWHNIVCYVYYDLTECILLKFISNIYRPISHHCDVFCY